MIKVSHNGIVTLRKMLNRRLYIILNQSLLINTIKMKKSDITGKIIQSHINNNFGGDKDYLYKYIYLKKEKIIYLYAVKGGESVSKIIDKKYNVSVMPIQMYILKFLINKTKLASFDVIFNFNNVIYFIKVNNKNIIENNIENTEDELIKSMKNSNISKFAFIDINLNSDFSKIYNNVSIIKIGDNLYEKVKDKSKLSS